MKKKGKAQKETGGSNRNLFVEEFYTRTNRKTDTYHDQLGILNVRGFTCYFETNTNTLIVRVYVSEESIIRDVSFPLLRMIQMDQIISTLTLHYLFCCSPWCLVWLNISHLWFKQMQMSFAPKSLMRKMLIRTCMVKQVPTLYYVHTMLVDNLTVFMPLILCRFTSWLYSGVQ